MKFSKRTLFVGSGVALAAAGATTATALLGGSPLLASATAHRTHQVHRLHQAAPAPARAPAGAPALVPMAPGARLTQLVAAQDFQIEGINWRSNGKCSDRQRSVCTSFQGLRYQSIAGIVAFKQQSGCPITISGGTERGHAVAKYSHHNGYKLDVMPTRCVTRYIHHNFRYLGLRGDGAQMYRAPSGYVYSNEHGTHWDIVFTTAWKAR